MPVIGQPSKNARLWAESVAKERELACQQAAYEARQRAKSKEENVKRWEEMKRKEIEEQERERVAREEENARKMRNKQKNLENWKKFIAEEAEKERIAREEEEKKLDQEINNFCSREALGVEILNEVVNQAITNFKATHQSQTQSSVDFSALAEKATKSAVSDFLKHHQYKPEVINQIKSRIPESQKIDIPTSNINRHNPFEGQKFEQPLHPTCKFNGKSFIPSWSTIGQCILAPTQCIQKAATNVTIKASMDPCFQAHVVNQHKFDPYLTHMPKHDPIEATKYAVKFMGAFSDGW
jgi:hypothetical protein